MSIIAPFTLNAALLAIDPSGSRRRQIQQDLLGLPNVCRQLANHQRIVNRYEAQARANGSSAGGQAWNQMMTKIQEVGNGIGELYPKLVDILYYAHERGWITQEERDGLTAQPSQGLGAVYDRAVPVIAITAGCALALAGIILVLTAPVWAPVLGVTAVIGGACAAAIALIGVVIAGPPALDALAQVVMQFFRPVVTTNPDGSQRVDKSPFDQIKDALSSPIVLGVAVIGGLLLLSSRGRSKKAA